MKPMTCRFLTACLQKIASKYPYNYGLFSDLLKKEQIKLPVTEPGQPNWDYMDKYMSHIWKDVSDRLLFFEKINKTINNVDITDWKEFAIGELFAISRPVARSQAKYQEGNVAFVASGNFNNGVTKWCQPEEAEKPDKGNCITVSPLDGSAFYQKNDFLG